MSISSSSSSSLATSSSSATSTYEISVDSSIRNRYEIDRTASYIYKGKYQRVALQFPDELLHDSPLVITELRKILLLFYTNNYTNSFPSSQVSSITNNTLLPIQLFILGDTSYGSCCVDEVAAAHGNADIIIHYGHACLSSPSTIPVYYVFHQSFDVNSYHIESIIMAIMEEINEIYNNNISSSSEPISSSSLNNNNEYIILLWDPDLTFTIPLIMDKLKQLLKNHNQYNKLLISSEDDTLSILHKHNHSYNSINNSDNDTDTKNTSITFQSPISFLLLPTLTKAYKHSSTVSTSSNNHENDKLLLSCCGFTLSSTSLATSINDTESFISNSRILYWGNKDSRCRLLTAQYAYAKKILYIPVIPSITSLPIIENIGHQASRIMAKRYRMIEAIRAANIIGIVCGTLAVEGHQKIITVLSSIIKESGKNLYILLLGKLNPAKLANFPEIDIFVMIACPESTFLDTTVSSSYSKPIATPHEVIIALSDYSNAAIIDQLPHKNKEWNGFSIVNFQELLPNTLSSSSTCSHDTNCCQSEATNNGTCACQTNLATDNEIEIAEEENNEIPVFSLLSSTTNNGTTAVLRKRTKPSSNNNNTVSSLRNSNIDPSLFSTALINKDTSSTIINYSQYGKAAEYYHTKRQWKGLSYDIEPDNLEQEFSRMNISSTVPSSIDETGNAGNDNTTTSQAIITVDEPSTVNKPKYNTTIHTGIHGIASSYTHEK